MHFDLLTLYGLAIGTLLVSAGMTFWERQALPQRRGELAVLATGYTTLALGCAVATVRTHLAGIALSAPSNLLIVGGYLLILNGVGALGGRTYRLPGAVLLAALAIAWVVAGAGGREAMWSYGSAFPIALICGVTTWEALHSDQMRRFRAHRIVAVVTGIHAALYLGRAVALPGLAAWYGPEMLSIVGKITMYDGVLYSVCLPMALLALVREEAHRQILEVSHTDYLTGLGTRRWFFEEAARVLATRSSCPLTLLVFDLDHFKAINDRHGHAIGDAVLKAFAAILPDALGRGAIVARMGGEEFAALLPGQTRHEARETGQAIARRLAETIVPAEQGATVTVTVSIGLAEFRTDAADLEGLLSAADRALYLAKRLGRNRVEAAQPVELAAVA